MSDKKTLLVTGAGPNGITGRLIKEHFQTAYKVLSPGSRDLDLTNEDAVREYFDSHRIDYVIHCATFRPGTNIAHKVDEILESNLRMYFTLASQSLKYKKMIYFGSGAEYDKSREIVELSEDAFGERIPADKYGFGKYVMNTHCRTSDNIYNMRLFGTINQYERFTKNIVSNLCVKAIKGLPLTLRRDCRFSFIDINDVLPILEFALNNELRHHDYNLTSGKQYLLSDIAAIVSDIAGVGEVKFSEEGLNKEYTGCNRRLAEEIHPVFSPIYESINKVFTHYKKIESSIDISDIDARWK